MKLSKRYAIVLTDPEYMMDSKRDTEAQGLQAVGAYTYICGFNGIYYHNTYMDAKENLQRVLRDNRKLDPGEYSIAVIAWERDDG